MKLTVKEGKANKIHIYVDEEYRATVDSDYWYSEKYRNYKEINEEELTESSNSISSSSLISFKLRYFSEYQ